MYDAQRSNLTPSRIDVPLKTLWTSDISPFVIFHRYPEEQTSSPVISGGVLYIGSTNGKFYAYDLKGGSLLWKFKAGYPLEAPAGAGEGAVCFGSADGVLRCLNSADGRELWNFQSKSEVISSPLIKDGRVYFSSADDRLNALDLKTGERLWSYSRNTFQTVSARIFSSPAASVSGDRLYQIFSDGSMVCLAAATGKELWSQKAIKSFASSEAVRRTPLVGGASVYAIDDAGSVISLNAENGKIKGIYPVIKAVDFVVDNKTLVLIGLNEAASVDISTGAVLWRRGLKYGPAASAFAAGESLFVIANHAHAPLGMQYFSKTRAYMQALNLLTGEFEWGGKVGSSTSGANASAVEGAAAFLLNDGRLVVLARKEKPAAAGPQPIN